MGQKSAMCLSCKVVSTRKIEESRKQGKGPQLQHAKLSLLWKQVDGDSTHLVRMLRMLDVWMSRSRGAHAVEPLQG